MSIKKLTAIILSLVMATGSLGLAYADTQQTPATAKDYNGHWAESTIQKWIDEGKINGYTDGSFKPDNKITRAEFVQLVNNSLVDYTSQTATPFADVKSGEWYEKAVNAAYATEYIKGYSQTQFAPTKNINREQAAAIMSRIQYLADNGAAVSAFSDSSKISTWAVGQVGAATNAKFVKGYDGKFNPLNNLTRAEAVTMLNNVLQNGKNEVIYKAGTELKDTTVEGDLIIAKTVGEGDVHLTNVEVKGNIKVYGGGVNSIYFNNVKVAKIEVEKEKVRLVLENGTTVQELAVGTEAKLENLGGTVAKVTIDSTGKVTLAGDFQNVQVVSKTNVILDNAKITNLVVEQPISILGTGTIATLTANADGIQIDSTAKATKTELGTGVTENPEIISGGGGGGPIGGGGETPKEYGINIIATVQDGSITNNVILTTDAYESDAIISDFLLGQVRPKIGQYGSLIDEYLLLTENRLKGLVIGETPLYIGGSLNVEAWDKLVGKLDSVDLEFEGSINNLLKDELSDGITTDDLEMILAFYDVYKVNGELDKALLQNDLDEILSKLSARTSDIVYSGEGTYQITYKGGTLTDQAETIDFIVENIAFSTSTVDEFFNEFGNITITAEYGTKKATFTIQKAEL